MVDLPLPVGPVTRTMPLGARMFCWKSPRTSSAKPRSSRFSETLRVSSTRITVFSPRLVGKVLTRRSILRPFEHHVHAAVLRQPALADVERGHDLDAAGDRGEQVLRHFQRLVQPAVDAVADPQAALGRLDVDVAGAFLDGVVDDVVDQPDDRRLAGDLLDVADVLDRLFDQRDFGRRPSLR